MPGTLGRDVRWLVETWARRTPEQPFLVWAPFDEPPRTWTRAGFAADVSRLASVLHRHGLREGGRLALVLPNCPSFLLGWAAATSLGAAAVCLDPRLSRDELAYALGHSGSGFVITTPDRGQDVAAAAPRARLYADGTVGADSFAALLAAEPEPYPGPSSWSSAASIQYTSGTTSRPKGVVWTQANCLWAGQVGAAHQRLTPADVNLIHLPLFHTNALSYSFLASLWSGGTVVLQPKFSASRFWDASVRQSVTWTSVVSFCLRALAGRPVPERHCYRGWGNSAVVEASPLTGGVPVTGWFGMTETVSHPIVSDPLHPAPPGCMGRPAPEYGITVTDEEGRQVEPGDVGELRVHGTSGISLFAAYLDAPELTAAACDEHGWFRTGDRVRLDPDGFLWFVERDQDVLKVGGENIGAPEIERVLLAAPGVCEAAVVGHPDPMLGEVPVAFVTARARQQLEVGQLQNWCAGRLGANKLPRQIRVVDDLPRSTLDKVSKAALRSLLREETPSS